MPFVVSNCSALWDPGTLTAALARSWCEALREDESLWGASGDYK